MVCLSLVIISHMLITVGALWVVLQWKHEYSQLNDTECDAVSNYMLFIPSPAFRSSQISCSRRSYLDSVERQVLALAK